MKKLLFVFLFGSAFPAVAQNTDTIKVMSYNLLNFPQVNSGRITDLKNIVQEALPDILMVCELTSSTGANSILNNALNQNGISYYSKASYVAGPDTDNMLYYNSNKLALKEQNEISTTLRDINEYVLYYKSDDIATTLDTTFFYCYVAHLKASTGFEADRNTEVTAAKNYMATRPGLENVLFGGDFNLYSSSTEPAWNTILNGAGVTLLDPVNTPGNWHADWGYANLHTQSTRTSSIDGGSGGGMDDRFDFIFMSPDLMSWANQAKMITGTYKAYGQDGSHYNSSITDAPTNISLPWTVIQSLHDMSDHLPVYAEIEVQRSFNGITDADNGIQAYYSPTAHQVHFSFAKDAVQTGEVKIYDLSGKEVMRFSSLPEDGVLDVSLLENGLYILKEASYGFTMKFVR